MSPEYRKAIAASDPSGSDLSVFGVGTQVKGEAREDEEEGIHSFALGVLAFGGAAR